MQSRLTYSFGMIQGANGLDVRVTTPILAQACEGMTKASGVVICGLHARSYRELQVGIERGQLGLAWMPPLLAIELDDRQKGSPLVLPVRRGADSYLSALITRRGGPKTLEELRGARVAWVDQNSAAGYLVPRMHLAASGLDPVGLFSQELFLGNHVAVVDALLTNRADVAATYCTADPRTSRIFTAGWTNHDGTQSKPVEVLWTSSPIPNDALVISAAVPTEVKAALLRWLTALDPKAREVFGALVRAERFRAATPAHYAPLRRMLTKAHAGGR